MWRAGAKEKDVTVEVPGLGRVTGDVAWAATASSSSRSTMKSYRSTTSSADRRHLAHRQALNLQGFPDVDHVELFGPGSAGAKARNFVLCHRHAYDRSPCGTGPARSSPASPPTASSPKARLGCRKHRRQPASVPPTLARSCQRQGGAAHLRHRLHHRGEARCCWTSSDPFCWALADETRVASWALCVVGYTRRSNARARQASSSSSATASRPRRLLVRIPA